MLPMYVHQISVLMAYMYVHVYAEILAKYVSTVSRIKSYEVIYPRNISGQNPIKANINQ